ncbi:hypothetical protein AAE029_08640 [Sinorhizobium sp. CB7]
MAALPLPDACGCFEQTTFYHQLGAQHLSFRSAATSGSPSGQTASIQAAISLIIRHERPASRHAEGVPVNFPSPFNAQISAEPAELPGIRILTAVAIPGTMRRVNSLEVSDDQNSSWGANSASTSMAAISLPVG